MMDGIDPTRWHYADELPDDISPNKRLRARDPKQPSTIGPLAQVWCIRERGYQWAPLPDLADPPPRLPDWRTATKAAWWPIELLDDGHAEPVVILFASGRWSERNGGIQLGTHFCPAHLYNQWVEDAVAAIPYANEAER